MNLLAEDSIRRLIAAVEGDEGVLDPFRDEIVNEFPIDPVARLTEEPQEGSTIPSTIAPQETFDAMTTSPKERVIAEKTFAQSTPGSSAAFQSAQAATGLNTGTFVRKLLAKQGLDYQWGATGQPDPVTGVTSFDCSGIIYAVLQGMGIPNPPRNSAAIYEHSKKISLAKAKKTRGAILYRPGHIEISLGNGKTIGAGSEGTGVRIGTADQFTHGGLIPELKLGKAIQEAKSSKKVKQVLKVQPQDPLNKLGNISSITSASTVFGSLIGELQDPKVVPEPADPNQKVPKGLKFVPRQYRSWIMEAAEKSGLSPRLIAYVMQKESGFSEDVVNFQRDSSAGARGPMQIMPFWSSTFGDEIFTDPRANVIAGAKILASYIEQQDGNLRRGLASYNAGPGNMSAGFGYADDILDSFLGRAA